ncbi:hypothetical protein EIP91_001464 [Steccherinum ochraceum]|uniref:Uncharacterized protein n=1 Tax=Steccherinum ochraceum TaxID=92696 RepID=A0A4R0RR94_9APHY|nr:hypothetical protein EIP91_001464 [Steccherinum ochraceum]
MPTTGESVALGIFGSYFLIILGLFGLIGHNVPIVGRGRTQRQQVFSVLAILSFAHTWYYMLAYLFWSFREYERETGGLVGKSVIDRLSSWLMDTGLFEQAWAIVSTNPMPWWWSEPICLYTVGAFTIFLATHGRNYAVKHLWTYMVLGQLVAISVATNLVFLSLLLSPELNRPDKSKAVSYAPPILWLSVLVALVTVGISPYTTKTTFLPNLLVMHIAIILPLLSFGNIARSRFALRTRTLYLLAALGSLALRIRTIVAALASLTSANQTLSGFLSVALSTLHSHPAQSSIGWDVIWTTISILVWTFLSPLSNQPFSSGGSPSAVLGTTTIASLLFSAGVGAPLAFRQDVDEGTSADGKRR